MITTDSNLEKHRAMKEIRENRPLRDPNAYRSLNFINNSSDRNLLLDKIKNVNNKIKNLDKKNLIEIIDIGKEALYIKGNLENYYKTARKKFSLESCYEYIFNKQIRRINEYIAIYLAIQNGSDVNLPLTINIKLGQALNSKDDNRREKAEKIIKTQCLTNGQPISHITIKDIRKEFEQKKTSIRKEIIKIKKKSFELKKDLNNFNDLLKSKNIKNSTKGEFNLELERLQKLLNQTISLMKEAQESLLPSVQFPLKKKLRDNSNSIPESGINCK